MSEAPVSIKKYVADTPLFTRKEAEIAGFDKHALIKAVDEGMLVKAQRGYYARPDLEFVRELDYAVACKATDGILYGISAARYHGLTNAIPQGTSIIRMDDGRSKFPLGNLMLDVRRTKLEKNLSVGVVDMDVQGLRFRMTDKPRTVVDVVRFRESPQFQIEAVRDYLAAGESLDELVAMAHEFNVDRLVAAMTWDVTTNERGPSM